MLQRWGSGVLPRRFPVALKALPEPWRLDRSGDRGAKKKRLKELEKLNKESESDPKNNGPFTQVYQKGWERIRELSKDKQGVMEHISIIPDYRQAWKVEHKLSDILLLTICAVISGAEGWEDIEDFGETHLDFLKQYGDFENGIPVHDTIARVVSCISPAKFHANDGSNISHHSSNVNHDRST